MCYIHNESRLILDMALLELWISLQKLITPNLICFWSLNLMLFAEYGKICLFFIFFALSFLFSFPVITIFTKTVVTTASLKIHLLPLWTAKNGKQFHIIFALSFNISLKRNFSVLWKPSLGTDMNMNEM